eukprot:4671893-Amphidinium_carterae.1
MTIESIGRMPLSIGSYVGVGEPGATCSVDNVDCGRMPPNLKRRDLLLKNGKIAQIKGMVRANTTALQLHSRCPWLLLEH